MEQNIFLQKYLKVVFHGGTQIYLWKSNGMPEENMKI